MSFKRFFGKSEFIFPLISFMMTVVFFFDPYPYRSSDLMECIPFLRREDFQHLFIAVRPILPLLGLITPISPALTITIINIIYR